MNWKLQRTKFVYPIPFTKIFKDADATDILVYDVMIDEGTGEETLNSKNSTFWLKFD